MNLATAIVVINRLIEATSLEINTIKSEVVAGIVMQVAIYSHDHIETDRLDFGVLGKSPCLSGEELGALEETKAVLLDREQRRNAFKHLKHLLEVGNEEATQLLEEELQRFFSTDEQYEFFLEPESEYPNEYVKPYPYT